MEYHECKRNNKKLLHISTCSTFGVAERHLVVTYVRTLTKSLKCKKKNYLISNWRTFPVNRLATVQYFMIDNESPEMYVLP